MYTAKNTIKEQPIKGLKIEKLHLEAQPEILSISLEKGSVFPEHTSPRNASLIVLQGELIFHVKNEEYKLSSQQLFQFEKEEPHWVEALQDSKFLIIR